LAKTATVVYNYIHSMANKAKRNIKKSLC